MSEAFGEARYRRHWWRGGEGVRRGAAVLLALAGLLSVPSAGALADGGGGGGGGGGDGDALEFRDPDYTEAARLIEAGEYRAALPVLRTVIAKEVELADAYNLLGYATRQLGRYAEALEHYGKALAIEPDHRGAHEYIGEAYLALDRLDKAKEHLAFLDDDCWLPCAEYSDLKEAIARYEARRGSAQR